MTTPAAANTQPTRVPIITPSPKPTATAAPEATPTVSPTATPTATPTAAPTATPAPIVTTPAAANTQPTRVPIITPSPKPTATAAPEVTASPTAAPTVEPTPSPTPVPDIATGTDLATPAPEATATPVPDIATGTDLVTPAPEAPDAPSEPEHEPETGMMSAEEMRSLLDETHPDRQVTLWVTCTDPDYANGSRLTLYANVSGYDGLPYTVVWEVDKQDGNGYVNAGVDGMMSLSFIINDDNVRWLWRVGVSLDYMEKE